LHSSDSFQCWELSFKEYGKNMSWSTITAFFLTEENHNISQNSMYLARKVESGTSRIGKSPVNHYRIIQIVNGLIFFLFIAVLFFVVLRCEVFTK
jgi:hypothetical protein